MPLQQIFTGNSSSGSRSQRKTVHCTTSTGSVTLDKVYTQDEKDAAGEYAPSLLQRSGSVSSTTCESNNAEICRICHSEADCDAVLISPCHCSGSLRYVHQKCLQRWIKSSQAKTCELCKYEFRMQSKTKPLTKWEKLDMSPVERRKILCSVTFHVVAITCVVWSLYVLIDRTTEEIAKGELEWPFWTKLIVVAIGFTGGVVFMYVQCKMYIQLCKRWKTYNRVIYIQTFQSEARPSTPPSPSPPPNPITLPDALNILPDSIASAERRRRDFTSDMHALEDGRYRTGSLPESALRNTNTSSQSTTTSNSKVVPASSPTMPNVLSVSSRRVGDEQALVVLEGPPSHHSEIPSPSRLPVNNTSNVSITFPDVQIVNEVSSNQSMEELLE
ncbi:hypothetical protein RvY_17850 [Ramazzottius varieornatus]|uniref:RING-CH-type domain-containing protein n=1 Tax=Ramazzottius varieornatus TaxID=947166 RepID=A0A1D1WA75_RAMVA|nr:hypothetical protein RvY_17850 [Ramazzottius varieornatus]